jgi:hypothetical protein
MDSWFDTYAVVLSEGTGAHDRHPLVAFDRALHGMKDRAVDDWTIHRAVATSLPDDGPHGLHRCAVAALCFLDRQLWALFQPLVEPVE